MNDSAKLRLNKGIFYTIIAFICFGILVVLCTLSITNVLALTASELGAAGTFLFALTCIFMLFAIDSFMDTGAAKSTKY